MTDCPFRESIYNKRPVVLKVSVGQGPASRDCLKTQHKNREAQFEISPDESRLGALQEGKIGNTLLRSTKTAPNSDKKREGDFCEQRAAVPACTGGTERHS